MPRQQNRSNESVLEQTRVEEPKMYRVFLLNDDYTTMDFVVMILMKIFRKTFDDAQRIMLNVHQGGRGLCGVYVFEVAETKVLQVREMAKQASFPLNCVMEEE